MVGRIPEAPIKTFCKGNSCQDCSFNANDSKQLDKHMNIQYVVKEERKKTGRLETLLAIKGVDIKQNRQERVGGGERCGA